MSINLGNIWSQSKNTVTMKSLPKINNRSNSLTKNKSNSLTKNKSNSLTKNKSNSLTKNKSNRAYWGTPTWYLFHTLAEKINNTWYITNYTIIWNFIKDVCARLPCPFCKNHAIKYVNSTNINDVKTKEGLKKVLFNFHNHANKSNINISVLEKYKKININKVLDLFENRFFISYIGNKQFNGWLNKNLKKKYYEFIDKIKHNLHN
jgi:hypothetical protein